MLVNPEIGYTVHVGDAVKDSEGALKDDALVYSRIDKILAVKRPSAQEDTQASWQAGSPFDLKAFNPSSCEACTHLKPVCRQAGFAFPAEAFKHSSVSRQAAKRASRFAFLLA